MSNTEQKTASTALTPEEHDRMYRRGHVLGSVVNTEFDMWWEREIVPAVETVDPAIMALARNLANRAWLGGAQCVLEVLK